MEIEGNKLIAMFLIFHQISLVQFFNSGFLYEMAPLTCISGEDYWKDCNRCWCVKNDNFVCDKLDCKSIPQTYWGKIKLKTSANHLRSGVSRHAVMEMLKEVGKKSALNAAMKLGEEAVEEVKKTFDSAKGYPQRVLDELKKVHVKILPPAVDEIVKGVRKGAAASSQTVMSFWRGLKKVVD